MRLRFQSTREPDEVGGLKIPYDKTRRGAHRLAWYLVLGLVLSPILYLGARALAGSYGRTANGTVTLDQLPIRAVEAGSVRELKVNPGDRITSGEVLVVLDSADLDAALARNAAQLDSLRALDRGTGAQRIAIDREIALLGRGVKYQRARCSAVQNLFDRGAATRAELDEATADLAAAETSLLRARRELVAQPPAADVARAERAVLQRRSGALTVLAPFDGSALAVSVEPGQYVTAGEPMITVARLDQPRVIAYVPPKFATRLAVGADATVYFPDGTHLRASVAVDPKLTARMPPDLVDQFGLRPTTVMLQLSPQQRWPQTERVEGLPVVVRFESSWEHTWLGARLGSALGWLAH